MTGYQPVVTTIQEGRGRSIEAHRVRRQPGVARHPCPRRRSPKARRRPAGSSPAGDLPAKADYRAGVVRELASVVERPIVLNHRLDTTLRVPLGRRVLVGGITRSLEPNQGEPNLYVFVEASLVDAQSAVTIPKQKR